MYLYILTSNLFYATGYFKFGCSSKPRDRLSNYLTGCPPGFEPCADLYFIAIWEVAATTQKELYHLEDIVHNKLNRYRCIRHHIGDSEWFRLPDGFLGAAERFIDAQSWTIRRVALEDIAPAERAPPRVMRLSYSQNTDYVQEDSQRLQLLIAHQEPVIQAIQKWILTDDEDAAYMTAPCGSGKTRMAVAAIRAAGPRCVVVLCPSQIIQEQWRTIITHASDQCLCIGGRLGTTDPRYIRRKWSDFQWILCTYASSPILMDFLDKDIDLIVLDEVHHMAGVVNPDAEAGEGRTRQFLYRAAELGIRRLGLTYTPRFVVHGARNTTDDNGKLVISMDDPTLFGRPVAQLRFRDLVNAGVLPDYRVWLVRDETLKAAGMEGKTALLAEAWKAQETRHSEQRPLLHHMIVFTATLDEARELEARLRAETESTLILRVEAGDDLVPVLAAFAAAPRAILVNCFVLGEGVDIPCAQAVAFTYPKQSRGQITQMVLRAGRWYPGKSVFHVILPVIDDEDLSGFEAVLSTLAADDNVLRDEIIYRSNRVTANQDSKDETHNPEEAFNRPPECIVIEESPSEAVAVRNIFTRVRTIIAKSMDTMFAIQSMCVERGIETRRGYEHLRLSMPELPEDPRTSERITWYDFLHPGMPLRKRIPHALFVRFLIEHPHLQRAERYTKWRQENTVYEGHALPLAQHILEGYFGASIKWSNVLPSVQRR